MINFVINFIKDNLKALQTSGHQTCHVLKINLFSNILGLDVLILICNKDDRFIPFFPTVLFDPVFQRRICKRKKLNKYYTYAINTKKFLYPTVHTTKQLRQESLIYRLKRNSYYVTHKLSYRILETYNSVAELRHGHYSVPEMLKVASFHNICQVHDLTDGTLRHLKIDCM